MSARILATARFALWTNLRRGLTRGGIALGFLLMALGPVVAVARDLAWGFDEQFGFFGFLVIALFGLRSGLQEQRELGLMTFFRLNLLRPVEHALAMVLSLLGSWLALCTVVFLAILIISGGRAGLAGWYTASWGIRTLLLLGFVPMVERVASFRLPLFVPALAYMTLLVVLTVLLPEARAIALFVPTELGDLDALRRLGLQAAVVFPVSAALFLLMTVVEPWVRRVVEVVPIQAPSPPVGMSE